MLFPLLLLLSFAAPDHEPFQTALRKGIDAPDRNDYPAARRNLESAARIAPEHAGVWVLLAHARAKQNDAKASQDAALKAERLAKGDPDVLHRLAQFYSEFHPDFPKAAAFEAQYAEKSGDKGAWQRVAALYLAAQSPDQAIEAGTKALKLGDSAGLRGTLGQAYAAKRDWPSAASHYAEALRLGAKSEEAHFRLAQAYLYQQDFRATSAVLENARKTFSQSAQIELALGVSYYGQRRFADAMDQFLRTMALDPSVPQPYIFAGRILEHAGPRMDEVTRRFQAYETANPQSYLGYLLHAKALVAQLPPAGFPESAATALDLLNRALALKEDDSEIHLNLGLLFERKGDLAAAARHLERSIELNGRESAAHFRLARVYTRLGRLDDAARERTLHLKLSQTEHESR